MINPVSNFEKIKKILTGMTVLKKQMKDMDERLSFYEERIATNRVMIEDNRADIDRLDDEMESR